MEKRNFYLRFRRSFSTLSLMAIGVLFAFSLTAQDYVHPNNVTPITYTPTIVPSDGAAYDYYDPAGPAADYTNNEELTLVLCPEDGVGPVTVNFTTVDVETGWDFLDIYYGQGLNNFVDDSDNGVTGGSSFTSTSADGCLTIDWDADASNVQSGWVGTVSAPANGGTAAAPPANHAASPQGGQDPIPPSNFTVPTTGADFVYTDMGGIGTGYIPNANNSAIFCPDGPGIVSIEFDVVDIETRTTTPGCWDRMTITDANGTLFDGCGEESGDGDVAGTDATNLVVGDRFTSTTADGCLTVLFVSDGTVQPEGWEARVSATGPAGPAIPTMGQWGLFLFALVSLTLGMVFMYRMETEKAVAGMSMSASTSGSLPFNMEVFQASMKHALGLAVVGFAIILVGWGEIVSMDLVGMMISIPVVAYMIHIAKMMKK